MHIATTNIKQSGKVHIWEAELESAFNELIISWNARRPKIGHFLISVQLKVAGSWQNELPYAVWGAEGQKSFDQDIIAVKEGFAKAFRVKIEAHDGADLSSLYALHASAINAESLTPTALVLPDEALQLPVSPLCQREIEHPRNNHMCSATSTCAVVQFLTQQSLSPLQFAKDSYDAGFDIYGNWVFACAESSHHLGPDWFAYVTRLVSFDAIAANLQKHIPSVISIRGPLQDSPSPNTQGHLLVVTGFDAKRERIFCMDPAFDTQDDCTTSYDAEALYAAWQRRGGYTYFFMMDSQACASH